MIKFRGIPLKDVSDIDDVDIKFDGTFVYGNYVKYGDDALIVGDVLETIRDKFWPSWWVPVDPKTVGQLIALQDAGYAIFENDLVRLTDDLEDRVYKVIYDEAKFQFSGSGVCYDFDEKFRSCKVIGNIHTRPELLEE